jgi:type II secretory pathway component GspD/PulD (secretin)/tetratricopeptide (TPR) repeat protein
VVARAFKQLWVCVALGALVACAVGELDNALLHAQAPPAVPAAPVPPPAQGRPSRARNALASGIDWLRRGDFELAATFFQQAKAGEDDLAPSEKEELANRIQYVESALKARKDGGEQLRKAEEAFKASRTQEALGLLKDVTNNPNLSPADRLRAQQLMEQIQPRSTMALQPTNSTTGIHPLLRARSMLQNARGLMLKGQLDAAEGLARDAKALDVTYTPTEDTPQKVLDDIHRARTAKMDAKALLTAARLALGRGDLDEAERLAKDSEKSQSSWSMHLFGDSPSKVLKEVKDARAKGAMATAKSNNEGGPAKAKGREGGAQVAAPPPGRDTDGARQALRDGRQALAVGNLDKAEYFARVAKEKSPDLNWWDDTPDKLLADIRRAGGAVAQAGSDKAKADSKAKTDADGDPRAMLREAREQFNHGKLDEAKELALKANSAGARWGLFEDSPDKLLGEIQTARGKRDKEESVKVLADARKLFEQGDYDEAERKAYQAERMHGSYSIWDLGERPHKLVAEIEAARLKNKKNKLPVPPNQVAQNDQNKDKGAASKTGPTGPVQTYNPTPAGESKLPPVVQQPHQQQPQQNPAGSGPGNGSVAQRPVAGGADGQYTSPLAGGSRSSTPGQDFTRQRARQLMAECRDLQKNGKLVEAHDKATEALKLGGGFELEDRPERALQELGALAEKQIENLKQAATDCASQGTSDPARYQQAESQLTQARQLALAFGLDVQPIDTKLAWVQQLQGGKGTVAQAAQPPSYLTPAGMQEGDRDRGLKLLEQARLEIRRGETGTARRIAEEAFSGKYGVQAEAAALLRSIDNEEFVQRQKELHRKVDLVVEAYKRKDLAQAKALADQIDMVQLPPEQRTRLKNVLDAPEMKQVAAVTPAAGIAIPGPAGAIPKANRPPQSGDTVAVNTTTTAGSGDFAQQIQAMQEIKFQQLRKKGIEAQQDAMSRLQAGQPDEAIDVLQAYRGQLEASGLAPDMAAILRRQIDKRIQDFKALKAQNEWEALRKDKGEKVFKQQADQALRQDNTRKQIAELMDQYKVFLREAKYEEAINFAMKAHELDPDNPATGAAMYTARVLKAQSRANERKKNENEHATFDLGDSEEMGARVNIDHPLDFDKDRTALSHKRGLPFQTIGSARKSEKEREIERRLNQPITVAFDHKPLKDVVDDLRELANINIVTDLPDLAQVGVKDDVPISVKLEGVAMKSALNVLLHQAELTYVIKDDVLHVTTPKAARGKLVQKTYSVADLVIPVDNFMVSPNANLMNVIGQNPNTQPNVQLGGTSPISGRNMLTNGVTTGTPSGSTSENQPSSDGHVPAATSTRAGTRAPGQAENIHEVLIKLITNTCSPNTWTDVGGPGTIDYFPLGMALIINQTPDVQEQVQDLLDALRRLQDLEVAVEVRMISLEESFFERIGIDFNVNLTQGALGHNNNFQTQVVTQQFQPLNLINFPNPHDVIAGLQPAGSGGGSPNGSIGALTSDLGIPIRSTSFQYAIPPFGGYPNIPGADGGLSMGLAFLSDIQVFMFMEAAQGDRRTNVMQAPKLTLFNGQTATIQIQDFQWFVTNVQVVQNAGQVVFVPQNQPIPMGINLAIQAVVSADRRFVRLNIAPTMTNLASATVPLFPITTFITPVFEGGAQGQPVPFTQFIQQPTFTTVQIQTTVSVPDGGTVLLGGLKLLNEGRNEFGPPVIGKIPYLDRLFRNVGYGKDTSSLLLMVTPRIIINTEEEFLQTGIDSTGLLTIAR